MSERSAALSLSPPYQLAWSSATRLSIAVAGNGKLYGITRAGSLTALAGSSGTQAWAGTATYINNRLARQGTRLFAYRRGEGLGYIDDLGSSATERLAMSFGANDGVAMSVPVIDDRLVYYAVNQGLYATHQEQGLAFGSILRDDTPHSIALISPREIVVINGRGIPTRFRVSDQGFQQVWVGDSPGIDAGLDEWPYVLAGNLLIIAIGTDIVAYELSTGHVAWRLANTPAKSFAVSGDTLFAGSSGAGIRALSLRDGSTLWYNRFIYNTLLQQSGYQLALFGDDTVITGGPVATNPDGFITAAFRAGTGAPLWLSRAASLDWTAGIPITDGNTLYTYGAPSTGAYVPVASVEVTPDRITVTPRPLRGPASGFGTGTVHVNLSKAASVSIAPYREALGVGALAANSASWGAGDHQVSWTASAPDGFTDLNQFGYMLVDVRQTDGAQYTQPILLPVNTFPDILTHWAKNNIEIMAYHLYVNGYEDQNFRPDNLVTRAESSTIIAKTLNLQSPSPGVRTKFTDISNHWARNFIMALEERGVVGGVQEPDGTYTFRPNVNMNRAEEARIVVRAYNIPAAPPGFSSRFTDISGHWAEADIKALESAGYVNGFRESDGSYTYRPQQNLTRAELCTMVVRIMGLTR